MNFVDTHCHIDTILEKTGGTAEALFEQMEPSLEAIIHVACDPDDFKWSKDFLQRKEIGKVKIHGVFGVHPLCAEKFREQAEENLLECLKLPEVVALGEIGLDYHYKEHSANTQKSVFLRQLEIGLELKKRFVFHLREAENDAFSILQEIDSENIKAHIHCYTSTVSFAEKILSLKGNYFFGFTGAVTFDKTPTIKEAAYVIPLNKILLETDAPYLAPVPFRGKICTPVMIPNIANVLAKIKDISTEDLLKICRENTREMYGV